MAKKGQRFTLTQEQRATRAEQCRIAQLNRWPAWTPKKWVLSLSGGKDSTATLLVVLREKLPLDEVVCFMGGWEFPELEAHMDRIEAREHITITRIRPERDYWECLKTWGWPHARIRWCTGMMRSAIDRHTRKCGKYIGLAADETERLAHYAKHEQNPRRHAAFPLAQYGLTSADALALCRSHGYDWGGLYDLFPRFGCYCCPLQRIRSLEKLWKRWPALWERMRVADESLPDKRKGRFKLRRSVAELGAEFEHKERQGTLV